MNVQFFFTDISIFRLTLPYFTVEQYFHNDVDTNKNNSNVTK